MYMNKLELEIASIIREIKRETGQYPTVGSVESATGGRIADKLTNIAGSSEYFTGAIVSYGNEIKIKVVGVQEDTINLYGAVSHETCREMAEGGQKLLKSDYCISTTGIAGPTGATPNKPVGLFYIGIASPEGVTSYNYNFTGSREKVKDKATQTALQILRDDLRNWLSTLEQVPPEEKHVVTCFLEHEKMILILRRSGKVTTYKRAWAGVSGYIETNPLDQAYTEIKEETGLFKSTIKLINAGKPLEVIDDNLHIKWIVHPFLFHITDPGRLQTDWEHTEFKWIFPKDVSKYNTVPGLMRALNSVLY
jgi:nicotinamide-nucleotide amidase